MRSNPENLTAEAVLDFRGSSKNYANYQFAIFRDHLSPACRLVSRHIPDNLKEMPCVQLGPCLSSGISPRANLPFYPFCGCKYNQFVTK